MRPPRASPSGWRRTSRRALAGAGATAASTGSSSAGRSPTPARLRCGSEKLEDEVRWPFKSRGGSGDVMGSAVLFVHEPGARADKLIACLRVRVAPIELIVMRRDYAVVVLDPYRRRSQHALQEAL